MSAAATAATGGAAARLRELWRSRPVIHSRPVWALLLALDRLPWPLGEDLCARLFAAASLARPGRRAAVRAWARQVDGGSPARLARAACAFRGRWVARSALLGVRAPETLLRHVSIRGEEHLSAAGGGGAILLGVHLGPPNADVVLRIAGHRLAWFGHRRTSAAWSRPPWRGLLDPKENLFRPTEERFWPGVLYRARKLLLDGGTVFVMADAWEGREVHRIPLPGGRVTIRAGWLSLHRQTGVPVLPVLTHLDGRTQVIAIHPPLPAARDGDDQEWRAPLTALVREHAARFPEQCPALLFPPRLARRLPT